MNNKSFMYCCILLILAGCQNNVNSGQTEVATKYPTFTSQSRYTKIHTAIQTITSTVPMLTLTNTETNTATNTMTSTSDHITEPVTTATKITKHNEGILFENPKCGIAFEYPVKWSIQQIINVDSDTRCAYGINPPDYSKIVETSDIELEEYADRKSVV
jgi:hypothetical protein